MIKNKISSRCNPRNIVFLYGFETYKFEIKYDIKNEMYNIYEVETGEYISCGENKVSCMNNASKVLNNKKNVKFASRVLVNSKSIKSRKNKVEGIVKVGKNVDIEYIRGLVNSFTVYAHTVSHEVFKINDVDIIDGEVACLCDTDGYWYNEILYVKYK